MAFFRVGRVSDYKNQPLYEIKPTAVAVGFFVMLLRIFEFVLTESDLSYSFIDFPVTEC